MKKIFQIIGILVLIILALFVNAQKSKDRRLKDINPSNFEIKYGAPAEWIDSGINAKNIKSIDVLEEENRHSIIIELNNDGLKIFKEITANNIGKQVGLFIRGIPVSAPFITQAIDNPFISIDAITNEEALTLKEDLLNEIPNPNAYFTTKTTGGSMAEYGSPEGQDAKIYYNQKCMPGDNCSFQCLVDKCVCSSSNCVKNGENYNGAIKRLVSIKNGCYWFEGNSNPVTNGDIEYRSFDSRTYGCLIPSEFLMNGVAR